MSLYLPNPCLIGIFLTISTYDGPQLVFHYPPRPNEYGFKAMPLAQDRTYLQTTGAVESSSSSSSDEDDEDMDGEDFTEDGASSGTRGNSNRTDSFHTHRSYTTDDDNEYLSGKALLDILDEQDRRRKRKENRKKKLMKNIMLSNVDTSIDNGSSQHNSNHNSALRNPKDSESHATSFTNHKQDKASALTKLFGFDIDFLTELITPSKKLCNTRFEITVDDMSFLGLPVHIYDDGSWKKSHKAKTRNSKRASRKSYNSKNTSSSEREDLRHNDGDDEHESGGDSDEDGSDGIVADSDDASASFNGSKGHSRATKHEKEDKCPMNMFHLVFAMNPPVVEYNHRIDEMYHYIISRLTLILRYEQHKSNYIYKESRKILTTKEEHQDMSVNELWDKILKESSLANIIFHTFQMASNNDIVNLDINGKIRSFQIPLRNEFTSLPPPSVSILRGSYLSSINPLFNNDAQPEDNDLLMHFALVLLDDPEVIIKDIQAEKDSIIANFIKLIKPTESLNKLSTISGLDLSQIFSFCFHLVLWRRAIVVPPLQTRNTYIVSPLAPLKSINYDAETFKAQFPSLPTLPAFLSMLSQHSKPRPYSTFLPSRDHRELYLEALAWLIKTGYALQLHTFIWLKVTPEIRVAVDEEIEMENFKKKDAARINAGPSSSVSNVKKADEMDQKATTVMTDNFVDNATKKLDNMALEPKSFEKRKPRKVISVEEEDTILLDPERATALERRWIAKIIEGKSPELIALFHRLLKYLNGKHALEMILFKENISRADVKRLLSSIDANIITVKHW